MSADLLLLGGRVCDGRGDIPPFAADVAVVGDRIADVGPGLREKYGAAKRVVDCSGRLITPGWVDVHTHYDGQVTFDPWMSPSTQHGVTTVAFGNCGVGFAPCRAADRGKLIDILEGVEDIPGSALHEGMTWTWETFPQYLDTLAQLRTAADFVAYLPHVPLRVYVMGERAHGTPTDGDIARMRELTAEAMRAGAVGLSTSRTLLHRDLNSVVIPGSYAGRAELIALFAGMADGGGGLFEILSDHADLEAEEDWIGKLSLAFRIPATIAFASSNIERIRRRCEFLERINARAGSELVTAQTSLKHQGCLQSLAGAYHPLLGYPTFQRELARLPLPDMVARMRDPGLRARILAETSYFAAKPFAQTIFNPANLYPIVPRGGRSPRYERDAATESFAALAKAAGAPDPMGLVYDALVDGAVLFAPLSAVASQEAPLYTMAQKHVKVGLGDGGAHLGIFQEASCPTFMLSHYVRDRTPAQGPRLPLHVAVAKQTSSTAALVGLRDRGVVAPGMRADLNVIDLERLDLGVPYVARDLPTGAARWMQDAVGYDMTICAGVPTFERGERTGALPGRLVRAPLRQHLRVRTLADIDCQSELSGPEPHSTHDTLVGDAELEGGASAIARAANKNTALLISDIGEFLSGELRQKAAVSAKL